MWRGPVYSSSILCLVFWLQQPPCSCGIPAPFCSSCCPYLAVLTCFGFYSLSGITCRQFVTGQQWLSVLRLMADSDIINKSWLTEYLLCLIPRSICWMSMSSERTININYLRNMQRSCNEKACLYFQEGFWAELEHLQLILAFVLMPPILTWLPII